MRYRGYPIEELAEKSNYLEVAYLIVKGELPDRKHYAAWESNIKTHTMVHENIKKFMEGFRYDAHPMGMLVGTIGALSTFYPEANNITDLESRRLRTIWRKWSPRHAPDSIRRRIGSPCPMRLPN